jgi:tetratricopeptide (TPR) repeat protein
VPIRSAQDIAWRSILASAYCLAACLALAGCITSPLQDRPWVRIQTQHFDVWSSLGVDDSTQLAIDLERFRAATAFLAGYEIPADAIRTRVFAFDDRGIGRPFAYHSQRSYLLARQPGDVIVLRTGGGWEGDAWTPVKLAFARRLIWNASPEVQPPWLDEGLPQIASTLESREAGALAGALRRDHVKTLRDSEWIPFERLIGATDLRGWSALERSVFEAESWALCHYLTFGEGERSLPKGALARYRARIRERAAPGPAARAEFGELHGLQHDVWDAVRAANFTEGALRIPWSGPRPDPRVVPRPEVLEQLGGLALAIGEPKLAAAFLEPKHGAGPSSARSLASAGDLAEARGDREAADARYAAALAAAPDDPVIHLHYADLVRARAAETSGDPVRPNPLAALARAHYARSIELSGGLAESHAGLASVYFVDGDDPADSLIHARTARKLLPGDGEIALLSARIELALGERATAREVATRAISRARTAPDLDAAGSLLAQIDEHDERASIR